MFCYVYVFDGLLILWMKNPIGFGDLVDMVMELAFYLEFMVFRGFFFSLKMLWFLQT